MPAQVAYSYSRPSELARLQELLAKTRRLGASLELVQLEGAKGIGKSFLVNELVRGAVEASIPSFVARPTAGGFGLWRALLEHLMETLPELGVLPKRIRTLRARLAPLLQTGFAAPEAEPEAEQAVDPERPARLARLATAPQRRAEAFEGVVELMTLLAREQAPLFVFDELECADAASLELLEFVLASLATPAALLSVQQRSLAPRGLLVVATRNRPSASELGAVSAEAREAIFESRLYSLLAERSSECLRLQSLNVEGVRAFLQGSESVDQLLAQTGGDPSKLDALLRGEEGGRRRTAPQRAETTRSERALLGVFLANPEGPKVAIRLTRLDALIRAQREHSVEAERDHGLVLDPDELPQVIRGMCDAGLLLGQGRGKTRSLRLIEATRQLELLGPLEAGHPLRGAWARALHEDSSSDPALEALAYRLAGEASLGLPAAQQAATACFDALAFEEAADLLETQLSASREQPGGLLGTPRQQASEARGSQASEGMRQCLDLLVDLYRLIAQPRRALYWLGQARALGGPWQAGTRAPDYALQVASLCLNLGAARQARRVCRRPSVAALSLDKDSALQLLALEAEASWALGEYGEAQQQASAALEALRATPRVGGTRGPGDPVIFELQNVLGKIHLHRAAYETAEEAFGLNLALAEEQHDHSEQARALNNLGVVAARQGDAQLAAQRYRDSLALALGPSDRKRAAFAAQNLAALEHEAGDYSAAIAHYHEALAIFTRGAASAQIARCGANLANLYVFLGDAPRAGELAKLALARARSIGEPYLVAYATLVSADVLRAAGDALGARQEMRQAMQQFDALESPRYAAEARLSLASALEASGDLSAARSLLAAVEATLANRSLPGLGASLQLKRASLALKAGDSALALRALQRARALLRERPCQADQVELLSLDGRLQQAFGEEARATECFEAARAELEQLALNVPVGHRQCFLAAPRFRTLLDQALPGLIALKPSFLPADTADPSEGATHRGSRHDLRLSPGPMIGQDPALLRVMSLGERLAGAETPVLIRGESGTGKELVADLLHRKSLRSKGPFLKVNCAAMHEELLLSELFGHEKGAFTGADRSRKGRFEQADGGTLFLDEIGDISPKAQVALLRVLQSGELQRVGGTQTLKVEVRLVCATHRDLEAMIAEGSFREDLYYRLKGASLWLPSLRERGGDIPLLVEHFLQKQAGRGQTRRDAASKTRGHSPSTQNQAHPLRQQMSPDLMQALCGYGWPGNIRELENVVASLSLMAQSETLGLELLDEHPEIAASFGAPGAVPVTSQPGPQGSETDPDFFALLKGGAVSLKDLKAQLEHSCIEQALRRSGGNISEAARQLGMKRSRLSQIVNSDASLKECLS